MTDLAAGRPATLGGGSSGPRVARSLRSLGNILIGLAILLVAYIEPRITDAFFTNSDALFVLGGILLLCGGGLRLNPFGAATTYWLIAFMLMLLGLFIGSVINGDSIRWLLAAVQYAFGFVILPYLLSNSYGDNYRRIIRFAMLLIAGMVVMETIGILVYYFYDGTYQDYQKIAKNFITGGRRLGAFLGQANWNAAIISMVLPFLIYLTAKKRIPLLLALACGAVLAEGLILSASFTGVVSSMIVVALFLLVYGTRYLLQAGIGIAVAVSIFLAGGFELPAVFQSRVGDALETGDLDQAGTYTDRMDLIREAWGIVDNTLVVGLGVDRYREVSAMQAPVHNMYLLLWAEGGLLALIGWMLLLTIVLLTCVRTLRYDRLTAALGLSVLAAFIIFSTASPHMYARVWLVPLVLAMIFMTEKIERNTSYAEDDTSKGGEIFGR